MTRLMIVTYHLYYDYGEDLLLTGHETKALLNNNGLSIKRSKLERDINAEIAFQIAILFVLCFIGGVGK